MENPRKKARKAHNKLGVKVERKLGMRTRVHFMEIWVFEVLLRVNFRARHNFKVEKVIFDSWTNFKPHESGNTASDTKKNGMKSFSPAPAICASNKKFFL